jgi:hypothetical protein
MYPYYLYLLENQQKLQKAVNHSVIKIESLQLERDMLKEELQRINHTTSLALISNTQIEELEHDLLRKEKQNEEMHQLNIQLLDMVSSAINSVSRLSYQLCDRSEKALVTNKNIISFLANCEIQIERMLEMILVKNIMFVDESINTVASI